jgi:lysozyme
MALNQASVDLIKRFEGWRSNAYVDPATGGEPITIGYGHTSAAGPPKVKLGMKISQEEGEAILRKDLEAVEETVRKAVTVPLNENQYGALVSFAFNLGGGNFRKSTLLKKVNAKDWAGAAAEFARWNKAAGKVMKGLTTRRAAEAELFLKPGPTKIGTTLPKVETIIKPQPTVPDTVTVQEPVGDPIATTPTARGNGRFFGALFAILAAIAAGILKLLEGN